MTNIQVITNIRDMAVRTFLPGFRDFIGHNNTLFGIAQRMGNEKWIAAKGFQFLVAKIRCILLYNFLQ